jgi:hypothetical protein
VYFEFLQNTKTSKVAWWILSQARDRTNDFKS